MTSAPPPQVVIQDGCDRAAAVLAVTLQMAALALLYLDLRLSVWETWIIAVLQTVPTLTSATQEERCFQTK